MSALRNLYNQNDNYSSVLLVQMGKYLFTINTLYIRQIIETQKLKYISTRSKSIVGTIRVQDKLIPIMDLRVKLGLEMRPINDRTSFIILKVKDRYLGIIVDKVMNIINVNQEDVQFSYLSNVKMSKIISGAYNSEQGEVLMLDPLKIY